MQRDGVRRTSQGEPHPISPTFLPYHSIRVLCCLQAALFIVATNSIALDAIKQKTADGLILCSCCEKKPKNDT